jgi:hypothetical protein
MLQQWFLSQPPKLALTLRRAEPRHQHLLAPLLLPAAAAAAVGAAAAAELAVKLWLACGAGGEAIRPHLTGQCVCWVFGEC